MSELVAENRWQVYQLKEAHTIQLKMIFPFLLVTKKILDLFQQTERR